MQDGAQQKERTEAPTRYLAYTQSRYLSGHFPRDWREYFCV